MTTTPSATRPGTIVVGVDGSPSASRALTWAIEQARRENRGITLVHGFSPTSLSWMSAPGLDRRVLVDALREDADAIVHDAARQVAEAAPDIAVDRVVRVSDPREVLLELSQDAALVVVGSRGRGTMASLMLGSVGVAVTRHAKCPVVVMRPTHEGTVRHGVLVGVDGTERSTAPLDFAYAMASARGLPLTVVHCVWDQLAAPVTAYLLDDEPRDDDLAPQHLAVAESTAGLAEKYPDVHVTIRIARGFADEILARWSDRMDIVVVGAHHGSNLAEATGGSVAAGVVEHAHSPVAVVPLG
ncbi:nucleotide-binding universal stress UspA family protein [Nocardioides ginsengisegetis]|uniref:Nucleotide-binding universal stress UspA family protein n=1 Tax=Nocardioides ginsengisegetis TaxID=661491 RepID=A0A7W3PAL2_9ACTN|nr:universal stress protein [Nocardioides ginsengisegetis]MBA8804599.1 nucleotide-binding universal stress UspA family protein [Nocardioides ginsengisegetis]